MTDPDRSTSPADDGAPTPDERRDGEDVSADVDTEGKPRRRPPRRADRPGTRPDADESPDLADGADASPAPESDHDRWLREQRPPHWE